MSKQKFVKNYLYNTAYQLLLILSPLVTAPYIARVLGVTGVSIANYTYSVVTYFVLFGTVGSSLFGQREIAYYQDDPVKRTAVFKEIFAFRFVTVMGSILVYGLTVARTGQYSAVYRWMLFELLAAAFDISWFFQGLEDFKKTVVRNVIVKLAGIALMFLFVRSPEHVNQYAVCMTLPTLVGNLSLWAYLPKYLVKAPLQIKNVAYYVKPMLALFVPQIAIEVYTVLDKTMLGMLASSIDSVGFYTYAQHIVKITLQLVTSLAVVMLPTISNAFAKGDTERIRELMSGSFRFVFVLGCPILFGLCGVANNLVAWFYGPGYEPVGTLIAITSPLVLVLGVSTVVGRQYLLPTKRQGAFTASVVVGAVVNFVLNLLLIPHYSAIGASVATIIAEFAVTAVQVFCVRKQLPFVQYFKENLRYVFFGAVMLVPVYLVGLVATGALCTALQVLVGAVVYFGLLVIFRDPFLLKYWHILLSKFRKVH